MADLTGQRLGQYQILARVSKGSTSTIYKGYQPKLDRFVAIKVLSPQIVDEENFYDRFTQEARAVAQLDHPNIVPVYDFDRVGDIAYIVFKYVESGTLRKMMAPDTPMELGLAVDIATQVGLALGYAHKRGVIHRDVKPSNVLIGEGHWALLTDFGLAKIVGGGRQLTRSGIGLGTPDYMSPEQAQGLPGDGRADLYSLGVMFFEMITGSLPFDADSSMGVVVKHITEPPPRPSQFNAKISPELEHVVLVALDKDPERRFQTAESMVAALVRAAMPASQVAAPRLDGGMLSPIRPIEPPAVASTKAGQPPAAKPQARKTSGERLALRGVLAAALVLLIVLGMWAFQSRWRPGFLSTPVAQAGVLPATPSGSAAPTHSPAQAAASPAPTHTPEPAGTRTPMPPLTLVPDTTKIKPGMYVRVVKPGGMNLFQEPGFDKRFITNLSFETVLYVLEGPVTADTLAWIKVAGEGRTGWAVQDDVVAYATRSGS